MKRIVTTVLVLVLAVTFCCSALAESTAPTTVPIIPPLELPGGEVPTEPVPEETQVPIIPGETQPPATEPANTPTAPEIYSIPVLTKNPTSEEVLPGGNCEFVARADGCRAILWRLIDANGTVWTPENVAETFKPIQIYGIGTDRLVLMDIPTEMDGWQVYAEFVGLDQSVRSQCAQLTVIHQEEPEADNTIDFNFDFGGMGLMVIMACVYFLLNQ